jgi:competence protein ComEA
MKSAFLWPISLWLTSLTNVASALDLNTATEADLDSLKGLGPAITQRIMQARTQAPFQDWADVHQRVKGIGPKLTASLVEQGVTVDAHHSAKSPYTSHPKRTSP